MYTHVFYEIKKPNKIGGLMVIALGDCCSVSLDVRSHRGSLLSQPLLLFDFLGAHPGLQIPGHLVDLPAALLDFVQKK